MFSKSSKLRKIDLRALVIYNLSPWHIQNKESPHCSRFASGADYFVIDAIRRQLLPLPLRLRAVRELLP